MGRAPCCDKANVKKGPWAPEEDAKLKEFIEKYGTGGNWIALPQKAGLKRCGKSCRLRWLNYLRPNIKHGEFSDDEDRIICSLFASIGSRWSIIAAQLPGRTDNDIKNYWNTKLKKKLLAMVPATPHKKSPFLPSSFQPSQQQDYFFASYYTQLSNISSLTSLLNHQEQIPPISLLSSSSSNPSSINNNFSVFQPPQESLYSTTPVQYYPGVREGLLMFGTHEASNATCSSSDNGSCMSQISYGKDIKQENQIGLQGFHEDHQNQSFVIDYGNNDANYHDHHDHHRSARGYFGNFGCNDNVAPLQYDQLEEVKQLMISTSNGSDLNTNNNNINNSSYCCLLNDENKTQERGGTMYYY